MRVNGDVNGLINFNNNYFAIGGGEVHAIDLAQPPQGGNIVLNIPAGIQLRGIPVNVVENRANIEAMKEVMNNIGPIEFRGFNPVLEIIRPAPNDDPVIVGAEPPKTANIHIHGTFVISEPGQLERVEEVVLKYQDTVLKLKGNIGYNDLEVTTDVPGHEVYEEHVEEGYMTFTVEAAGLYQDGDN